MNKVFNIYKYFFLFCSLRFALFGDLIFSNRKIFPSLFSLFFFIFFELNFLCITSNNNRLTKTLYWRQNNRMKMNLCSWRCEILSAFAIHSLERSFLWQNKYFLYYQLIRKYPSRKSIHLFYLTHSVSLSRFSRHIRHSVVAMVAYN